jgi:hypothetical protein
VGTPGLSRAVRSAFFQATRLQHVAFFFEQQRVMVLQLFEVLLLVGVTGCWPAQQAGLTYTE